MKGHSEPPETLLDIETDTRYFEKKKKNPQEKKDITYKVEEHLPIGETMLKGLKTEPQPAPQKKPLIQV